MAMIEDNKDNRQKSDEILKAKKRAMLILQHNDSGSLLTNLIRQVFQKKPWKVRLSMSEAFII